MKYYDWDEEKNQQLKDEREISFEEVVEAIENNRVLDIKEHPNKKKYGNQRIYIVEVNNYAYSVPFVEDENKIFLKTIFPDRKATKEYIIERSKR